MTRTRYTDAIERVRIGHHLRPWPWALAGKPHFGIEVDASDIDVICSVQDCETFAKVLWTAISLRLGNGQARRVQ